jgi:hypothetical protein
MKQMCSHVHPHLTPALSPPSEGAERGKTARRSYFAMISKCVSCHYISRNALWLVCLLAAGPLFAAEHAFVFSTASTNPPLADCTSIVAGEGKPGGWKVIMDDVPLLLPPISSNAPATTQKAVVAQTAGDTTDEHFPILVLGDEVYGDFTFTTRFKIVGGQTEQMAGIAFRIQDEKNFYVLRASALGQNVLFYKVVDGHRGELLGPKMEVPKGVWQELSVRCKGNTILCLFNGKPLFPVPFNDDSLNKGKVGFWTKSDSVSYFTDAHISYTPREPFIQQIVRDTMKLYPRLIGLQVFMPRPQAPELRLVAGSDETDIGKSGGKAEADVIKRGVNYYGKEKDKVVVTMPLRDRNGDPVASVRVMMKTFPGQTEENALLRAMPVIKTMEQRVAAVDSLLD